MGKEGAWIALAYIGWPAQCVILHINFYFLCFQIFVIPTMSQSVYSILSPYSSDDMCCRMHKPHCS